MIRVVRVNMGVLKHVFFSDGTLTLALEIDMSNLKAYLYK